MTSPMYNCGKLSGRQNFLQWHFELTHYFEAINLKNTLAATDKVDERSRLLAMEILRLYISPSQLPLVAECCTPKEAIDRLYEEYYPNTLESHASIRSEIAHITHGGVGQSDEFLFKICFKFLELCKSGAVVTAGEIMSTMLYKLPAELAYLTPKLNNCRTVKEFARIVQDADNEIAMARARTLQELERRNRCRVVRKLFAHYD